MVSSAQLFEPSSARPSSHHAPARRCCCKAPSCGTNPARTPWPIQGRIETLHGAHRFPCGVPGLCRLGSRGRTRNWYCNTHLRTIACCSQMSPTYHRTLPTIYRCLPGRQLTFHPSGSDPPPSERTTTVVASLTRRRIWVEPNVVYFSESARPGSYVAGALLALPHVSTQN